MDGHSGLSRVWIAHPGQDHFETDVWSHRDRTVRRSQTSGHDRSSVGGSCKLRATPITCTGTTSNEAAAVEKLGA